MPPIFVVVELDDYLEVSQTMLLTLSNRGRVSHINRAGCELLGRDEADILATNWAETFVPASVRSRLRTLFRRHMAGDEKLGHFESPVVSRTRGERLVAWHAAPIRLADGRVAGMILSGLDVTDRERNRKSRERLLKELGDVKFALDQSAIVATTDLGGAITAVNDKFCEISKYSHEELLGNDHRIVNSGYHGTDFFRDLWSTITAGRIWHGEIRNRARDGAIYWVDTTIVPFLDAQGQPYQYMAIRYEVTERKAAEARLRQRETLARLGQMSAMVAHEVKNPLAGISGALQVIGSRLPAESRDRKILDDIEDRITALNRMLQDLLTFASPREPVPAPTAVSTVIGEAAATIRSDPAMAGIRVEIRGEEVSSPWRKSRIRPGPDSISSRTLKAHGDGQETDSTAGFAAMGDDGGFADERRPSLLRASEPGAGSGRLRRLRRGTVRRVLRGADGPTEPASWAVFPDAVDRLLRGPVLGAGNCVAGGRLSEPAVVPGPGGD